MPKIDGAPKCYPQLYPRVLPKLTAKLGSTLTKMSDIVAPQWIIAQDTASEFMASVSTVMTNVTMATKEIIIENADMLRKGAANTTEILTIIETTLTDVFTNEYVLVAIFDVLILFLMGMQRILPKSLFVADAKKNIESRRSKHSLSAAMKIGQVRRRHKNRR